MPEILIIGYGNRLCGDDGVGVQAAHELERHFAGDPGVRVVTSQQLTPEMADDMAACGLVLFLDASGAEEAGEIRSFRVEPCTHDGCFVHHLSPGALLASVAKLYEKAPQAMCITVSGCGFAVGDGLSPRVQLSLAEVVREARAIIAEWQRKNRSKASLPKSDTNA